jgi:CIC family chloride channel protein
LLLAVALARFFTGPLSYAAGTPGGLFAPIVALGALLGSAGGSALHALQPELAPSPAAFAVAGMAAFFTATIRAPLTGIVICLEMTGCYQLFLPMLAACLGSHVSSAMLRAEPIYDALAAQAVPKV